MEQQHKRQPRLTRGDKCILIHIAVTWFLVLIVAIIYIVHLCMVEHSSYYDTVRVTRRSLEEDLDYDDEDIDIRLSVPSYTSVGAAYINMSAPKVICSTILLKPKWSLAPAHCVSIRSDPDLSQYLPMWRIRYKEDGYKETDIKRGFMHSYFNKDDFDNNVGLFEHLDLITVSELACELKELVYSVKEHCPKILRRLCEKIDVFPVFPVARVHINGDSGYFQARFQIHDDGSLSDRLT